ncbi:MAG: hypothetical protein ACRC78_02635 [Planktothrix sp.]
MQPVDCLSMTFQPEIACDVIFGDRQILLVANASDHMITYKGPMLIHTLEYPESWDKSELVGDQEFMADYKKCVEQVDRMLNELGATREDFPQFSIVGFIVVEGVYQYISEDQFKADQEFHMEARSLGEIINDCEIDDEGNDPRVYAIKFGESYHVFPPILDVIPPSGVVAGEPWGAKDMLHLIAFKIALASKRIDPDSIKDESEEPEDEDIKHRRRRR